MRKFVIITRVETVEKVLHLTRIKIKIRTQITFFLHNNNNRIISLNNNNNYREKKWLQIKKIIEIIITVLQIKEGILKKQVNLLIL